MGVGKSFEVVARGEDERGNNRYFFFPACQCAAYVDATA